MLDRVVAGHGTSFAAVVRRDAVDQVVAAPPHDPPRPIRHAQGRRVTPGLHGIADEDPLLPIPDAITAAASFPASARRC